MKTIFSILILAAALVANGQTTNAPGIRPPTGFTPTTNAPVEVSSPAISNVLYVAKSGNNSTAVKGRLERPYLTITAAKNAATNGETIIVHPGVYAENNLLKKGVNYHFMNGAVINWMDANNGTPGYGIFDDRPVGATTNTISGDGVFIFNQGTNCIVDENLCQAYFGNTNSVGAVVITNALSTLNLKCRKISASGFYTFQPAVWIENCNNSYLDIDEIDDPYNTTTLNVESELCETTFTAPSRSMGIYWNIGELHANVRHIGRMTSYGLYAQGLSTNDVANMWLTMGDMDCKIYLVGYTRNYRLWVNAQQIKPFITQGALSTPIECFGAAKVYVYAEKMEAVGVQPVMNFTTNSPSTPTIGQGEAWITCQKLTGPAFIWQDTWTNRLSVQHYEENLPLGAIAQPSFRVTGGELIVYGGDALKTNRTSLIYHGGGKSRYVGFHGVNLSPSTNSPVYVNASGLSLENSTFVAPGVSSSIYATNSQNVGIYGTVMANVAKHSNITAQPAGTIIVDANVQ